MSAISAASIAWWSTPTHSHGQALREGYVCPGRRLYKACLGCHRHERVQGASGATTRTLVPVGCAPRPSRSECYQFIDSAHVSTALSRRTTTEYGHFTGDPSEADLTRLAALAISERPGSGHDGLTASHLGGQQKQPSVDHGLDGGLLIRLKRSSEWYVYPSVAARLLDRKECCA